VQYYHEDETFANQKTDRHYELTTLYSKLTGSIITHVDDEFDPLLKAKKLPSKLLVIFDERHHEEAQEAFKKEFNGDASIVCGLFNWFVEVLSPQVNKGEGLKKMTKFLNVPTEKCIAFGDGANDLEFIQYSGKGIAMKNARDIVKAVADEVIDLTNDENGVSKTLQVMEEKGQLGGRSR
jgi:5-amino-6-(5-phospho-D-ribitylamino)uracil phosphatase